MLLKCFAICDKSASLTQTKINKFFSNWYTEKTLRNKLLCWRQTWQTGPWRWRRQQQQQISAGAIARQLEANSRTRPDISRRAAHSANYNGPALKGVVLLHTWERALFACRKSLQIRAPHTFAMRSKPKSTLERSRENVWRQFHSRTGT